MRAAVIERPGPPEAIRYVELPRPEPRADEVLVRMTAVAVNHVDTYIRSSAFPIDLPFPFIIGRDMVGVVEAVGAEARRFKPGDRVWSNCLGIDGLQGSFAEYLCVPEDRLFPLPPEADPIEAVAVLHAALTASIGLLDKARVSAGETLFIRGGSGSVGSAVLQVAKRLGARVAVTAGSDEKGAWCRELGADRVIDYRAEDVVSAVRTFAPRGVDIYWDATPGLDMVQALEVLAHGGRVVVMAGLDHRCELPVGPFYTRNATLFGFTVTGKDTAEYQRHAQRIGQWLAEGALRAKAHAILPLSEAASAHRMQEEGRLFGKIVLVPEDAAAPRP